MEEVKPKRMVKLNNKISKLAKTINRKVGRSKPCFKTKFYFRIMSMMHKGMPWNQIETDYWKEKGWIK